MNYLPLLLSLFLVDLLAVISPGPNFLVVSQSALQHSRWHGAMTAAGVTAGALVWAAATMLGLNAVFEWAPWLHETIRIAGGLYLMYLGFSVWRARGDLPASGLASRPSRLARAFLRGFLTSVTNPKSALYFASVFAQFVGPQTPLWVLLAAFAIVAATSPLWFAVLIAGLSSAPARRTFLRFKRWCDGLAGAAMFVFGARLVLQRD